MSDIHSFEPLFGSWYVDGVLGKGSFGNVYRVSRSEYGNTFFSAVKHISIEDTEDVSTEQQVQALSREININYQLRGETHFVCFEDSVFLPKQDGKGMDVFIRMELLTSLPQYMKTNSMQEQDVVRLGTEICQALDGLEKRGIIHRDIKPANIFISQNGSFKLGDFGVARSLGGTTSGMTVAGTFNYMAPEIYRGGTVNLTADIYSLGLVLYRLLNGDRAPFLPLPPASPSYEEANAAISRRMNGEPLPPPAYASPHLAEVILRACAYDPGRRFQSAMEFSAALQGNPAGLTVAGGYPGQNGYPGEGSFNGQNGYPGEGSFNGQNGYPGEGSLNGQSVYPGNNGSAGSPGYAGQDDPTVFGGVPSAYGGQRKKIPAAAVGIAAGVAGAGLILGLAWSMLQRSQDSGLPAETGSPAAAVTDVQLAAEEAVETDGQAPEASPEEAGQEQTAAPEEAAPSPTASPAPVWDWVMDEAELLTEAEQTDLESLARQLSQRYDCGIYVVIVENYQDYSSNTGVSAAQNAFDQKDLGIGYDDSGILLLLSTKDLAYGLVRSGYAETAFTDYGLEQLEIAFLTELQRGSWYSGLRTYLDTCGDMLSQARAGNPVDKVSEYLLPNSDWAYVTAEDLSALTWEECCFARNEIYARHGRQFSTPEITAYFSGKSWYHGTIPPTSFNEGILSDVERANIQFIYKYELDTYGRSYY